MLVKIVILKTDTDSGAQRMFRLTFNLPQKCYLHQFSEIEFPKTLLNVSKDQMNLVKKSPQKIYFKPSKLLVKIEKILNLSFSSSAAIGAFGGGWITLEIFVVNNCFRSIFRVFNTVKNITKSFQTEYLNSFENKMFYFRQFPSSLPLAVPTT